MTTYKYSTPDSTEFVADVDVSDPEIISASSDAVRSWVAQGNQILACTHNWSWEQIRNKRNKLLSETDWWAVSDRQMTSSQLEYRQALRDITSIYATPDDVVFPSKPE